MTHENPTDEELREAARTISQGCNKRLHCDCCPIKAWCVYEVPGDAPLPE